MNKGLCYDFFVLGVFFGGVVIGLIVFTFVYKQNIIAIEKVMEKCNSCENGFDRTNGNGYQPCGCKK